MVYRGIVKGGVSSSSTPPPIPDGTPVHITVANGLEEHADNAPSSTPSNKASSKPAPLKSVRADLNPPDLE
jgi:hypothetical protein